MPDMNLPNYFYGDETMQFTYFCIPCQLITHPRFMHLSIDSKLLYGMLLDRMSLPIKDEICSNLNCGQDKVMKLMAELDTSKGVGLIERIKQVQLRNATQNGRQEETETGRAQGSVRSVVQKTICKLKNWCETGKRAKSRHTKAVGSLPLLSPTIPIQSIRLQ